MTRSRTGITGNGRRKNEDGLPKRKTRGKKGRRRGACIEQKHEEERPRSMQVVEIDEERLATREQVGI